LDQVGQGVGAARVFIPEGDGVMEALAPTPKGLFVKELVGGPSRVRYYNDQGKQVRELDFKEPTAVQQMLVRKGEELTFRRIRYTEPYAWYTFNPLSNATVRTSLAGTSPVKFDDVEVVRETAKSKDGTQVPLTILRRKGTRQDGSAPAILYGYGGYGISLAPDFRLSRRLWLNAGGIYVIANLRGGGEYGEEWHKAGNLTRKQNVFDDFIACSEHLIAKRHTSPGRLGIQGGSNGGLLVGAALTQRPDLFRAVVGQVGIYDMLRVELEPNGAFNVTEFGSVRDRAQFDALYAYSPFHRVKDGTAYPAVLLSTGENDGRVNPYNSRKMTARLQAATSSGRPVLLRTSSSAGHGMGSSLRDRIQEEADVLAFFLEQLGADLSAWVSKSAVERGPWTGAVTPNSAVVKAKLRDRGAQARLVVSRDASFRDATRTEPQTAEAACGRVVGFELSGLQPDTVYHYALEVGGRLERDVAGRFRTFPAAGSSSSFTFAFASCGETGSTNASYAMIRRHQPLFYINDGDLHYQNIRVDEVRRFRRAYDRVLGSPVQAALYREVPLDYVWDDHDFGGDNANRTVASLPAALATYREYFPHYPLPLADSDRSIGHTFSVGRVKFIVTDLRSHRDPNNQKDDAGKTMMGSRQKEWFKQELLAANGRFPLIFWVSSVPWIGTAGTNHYRVATNYVGYLHHTNITAQMRPARREESEGADDAPAAPAAQAPAGRPGRAGARPGAGFGRPSSYPYGEDHWSVYATERRELADFIKQNNIQGLAILHGDAHMLAADDGTHSDYATGGGARVPVMGAGPLDQNPSIKGGPYSQGVYRTRKGEGCFGLITVRDEGQRLQVSFSGRNNRDEEKVSLQFAVPGR
jgi:phosphodiesterase/alkaline phosphatase D-like protein/dienelactone hydrolase